MREYRRHLPHQVPDGAAIFLTWNLKRGNPARGERPIASGTRVARSRTTAKSRIAARSRLRHGKLIFAKADEFLDRATTGPLHLKDPVAATIVEEAILFGAHDRYELLASCVMANHVHVLILPLWELPKITRGLKGFTAYQINGVQESRGRTFWQDESYDHWVRDEDELLRIIMYIENNPVKAALCRTAEAWPWSSARFRTNWPAGEVYRTSGFPA